MVQYFIRGDGNNSNAGTGPGTGSAWQTLAKALHAGSPVTNGDTVYVAPGTYREIITLAITPTANVSIVGDYAAAQFGDLDGGEVRWSAFLTNDTTAPSASPLLTLNGKSFFTFQGFVMLGGGSNTGSCVLGVSGSTNITLRNNAFFPHRSTGNCATVAINLPTVDVPANLTIERNLIVVAAGTSSFGFASTPSSSATAEYDANVLIRNNLFVCGGGSFAVSLSKGGSSTFPAGGVTIDHNTILGAGNGVSVTFTTARNFRYPVVVLQNLLLGCSTGLTTTAGMEGTMLEDLNLLHGVQTVRSNTLAGAGTVTNSSYAALLSLGQEALFGMRPRTLFAPLRDSPLANWSNHQLAHGVAGTAADDAAVGTTAWTNPGNTASSDDARAVASAVPATTGVSQYLKLTNFGFALPAGATVTGVRVDWERSASAGTAISTNSIKLVKAGAVAGSEMVGADTAQWTTTDVAFTHGGPANLWGTTWTRDEINAAGFGVAISAKNTSGAGVDARIDFVRVAVFYTASGGAGVTAVDLGNNPRPYGSAQSAAVGALERENVATKSLGTYHTDPPAGLLTGFGYQDFVVPVAAVATTLRLWMQKGAAYAGDEPQLQVVNGAECGVADAATSMTAAVSVWEQVSVAITPTRAGLVTLRVLSRADTTAGLLYFDDAEIV
jgi:hypothetical protein